MTIAWTGFPAAVIAANGDIIVGLDGGATNARFLATSWLFSANNLSDVPDAVEAFDNISPLTTKGDLLWFNGSNHNARIGIGTLNQIFAVGASNTPGWINNPGLLIANNLDDLDDLATALVNLGLDPTADITFDTVTATTNITTPKVTTTGLNVDSHTNAITAHVGGGQGSATALTTAINRVTTVATAGNSVKLPAAIAGESIVVINAAASNSMDCFPASGEVINALAANTALAIAANKTVMFVCAVNGTWNSIVTA